METNRDIIIDTDFEPIGGVATEDITTDFEPMMGFQISDTLEIPRDDINTALGRGIMFNVSPSLAFESKDELTDQLKSYNLEAIDRDAPKINQLNISAKGLTIGWEKERLMEEYSGYGVRELSSGVDYTPDSPEGKRITEIEKRMQEITTEEKDFNTFEYVTGMTGYSARQWGSLMFKLGQGVGWGSVGGLVLGSPTGLGVAVTVPAGATVGGGMAMWQYSYNLEAGNAYHELKKLRDEEGNPLEPELVRGASKAIGTINTTIELASDYFIFKLIPGGKRLIGTQRGIDMAKREVMDRLKESLSKPTLRKAILSSINKLTAVSSIEGLEEFIQGISAGRVREGAKLLSQGEFEPTSLIEDAKNSLQEALAATIGTATTLGLGVSGMEIYSQIGAIKRSEQSQKLFNDIIETVNQSELNKTNPEIIKDTVNRITSKNGIENVYISEEIWNNYWTNKDISPEIATAEVNGKKVNGNLEIPIGKYMEKIAPSPEITSALMGDVKFKEDELSLNEANKAVEEIKTQTEAIKTEAPITEAEIEAREDTQLTQLLESDRELTDDEISKLISGEDIGEPVTEVTKPDTEDLINREQDEVKQHVDLSIIAANKGKLDIAEAEAEKARVNGEALKLADGEEIDRMVEADLSRLPEPQAGGGKGEILLDKEQNELIDLDNNPIVSNVDGTITLYHRTTPEAAKEIQRTGKFKSLENTKETFFSTKESGQAEGYGDTIVTIKAKPSDVRLDDAFHGGEIHVTILTKKLSKSSLISHPPSAEGVEGLSEKASPLKTKEAWEMTSEEFANIGLRNNYIEKPDGWYQINANGTIAKVSNEHIKRMKKEVFVGSHKQRVQQALSEGKPVPAEVLKDYPDLKPTTKEPLAVEQGKVLHDNKVVTSEKEAREMYDANVGMIKLLGDEAITPSFADYYAALKKQFNKPNNESSATDIMHDLALKRGAFWEKPLKVEQGKVDTKLQAKIDKATNEVKRAEAMQDLYKIAADCLKG